MLLQGQVCHTQIASFDLIRIQEIDPSIRVFLPYTTADCFVGAAVYPPRSCAVLRRPVAHALARVQKRLRARGLGLKVWDAYRPFSIQEKFWNAFPNPKYVAQPTRGPFGEMVSGSVHSRGAAVDVTLVDLDGTELEMPTKFDDFSERAHRSNRYATPAALLNREILATAMESEGFVGLSTEWWHFDFSGYEIFPLSDEPLVLENER